MSKKCGVRSLSDSALAELANQIVSTIGYAKYAPDVVLDIDIVMVDINQYLEQTGATWNIYQDLLRVILSSDYLDANMRFTCLQMLLNGSVSFLVTEVFPFSYYEKILQVIAAQGTGLRVLNLKGVWVKEEHMHYLFEIVRKCKYLTKLFVPYIANDDLLEVIAKHCRQLKVLDISGETDITEIGIESLSHGVCNEILTVVDIGMPGEENICYSDIALILEHCPNVETLSTYSFVGASLKFVHDNIDENFTCKLRYLHDTGTDEATLRVIMKTCPHLESLYLDTPKAGSLSVLTSTYLRKLKVYKFSCAEVMEVLDKIGHNLSHLTMIKGVGHMEISEIVRACPLLVDLDCYMMDGLAYTKDTHRFECLEGLEMLSSPMSNTSLKLLICSCRQLKRLAVDSINFTDEDIVNVCSEVVKSLENRQFRV
uniref:F-box protein SKP2B n=1 Tax=Zeugodacus cucurbitae TaxID=28588 RepID=A0A0A1WH27_ZEUCU